MASPTDVPFNSASNVHFHSAEEGTSLLNSNISSNGGDNIKAKKSTTAVWITIGVVAVMCILGSAAYVTTGKVQPDMVVEHNEHAGMNQQVKGAPSASVQVQSSTNSHQYVNPSTAETWKNVPIEQHEEELQKDHEAKLEDYASSGEGAKRRREHGQFYTEKHAHDNEPKKSAKQLAKEKAERQEQWIKDKALQNKREAEAIYERTRTAKKNKAAYL